MTKQDELTKRKKRVGNNVSHSKRRTKTTNELNLKKKKFTLNGKTLRLRITTKTLKTITKNGLSSLVKKLKIKF
jgi:large subunit ribosomal protein L28